MTVNGSTPAIYPGEEVAVMEATEIPTISHGDFNNRLTVHTTRRLPLSGMIEITHRCNFRCAHCYLSHGVVQPELTTQELYDLIDAIVEEGCMRLVFTGGEPFVRSDFLDIYTYAKRRGLLVTIFTNGSLITPQISDHLRDFPPVRVSISIYGATEKTYEKVTGSAESYQCTMKAIGLLADRGIPFELKTMVISLNRGEFWEMKRLAEGFGAEFRYDTFITNDVDRSGRPLALRISPEDAAKLVLSDKKVLSDIKDFCGRSLGPSKFPENLFGCGAGRFSFAVDPYGALMVCLMFRDPSYNLREGSFRKRFHEGFYTFFPEIRARKVTGSYECTSCPIINFCNCCPGHAYLEYGDPEKPIEYACRVAHLIIQKIGIIVDEVVDEAVSSLKERGEQRDDSIAEAV